MDCHCRSTSNLFSFLFLPSFLPSFLRLLDSLGSRQHCVERAQGVAEGTEGADTASGEEVRI